MIPTFPSTVMQKLAAARRTPNPQLREGMVGLGTTNLGPSLGAWLQGTPSRRPMNLADLLNRGQTMQTQTAPMSRQAMLLGRY